MSKRVAERELTDRNWDQEDEVEEAGEFAKASDDTLKKRHVIRAKRRGAAGDKSATAFTGFAGFGGFKPVQTSTPFSFSTKSMTNGKTEDKKAESPFLTKTAASPKANGKQEAKEDSSKKANVVSDQNDNSKGEGQAQYLLNLKNLNESVLAWIRQHVEKNPYCILTPIFNDYEKHLKEIEKDKGPEAVNKMGTVSDSSKDSQSGKDVQNSSSSSTSQSSNSLSAMFKPATGSWTCDTCLISNKAEASKCVACQTAKPATKTAPVQSKAETSSISDKFKPPTGNWTCDTCLVSNPGDKEECLACQTAKPGSSKPAAKPVSGFSIGKDAFSSSNAFTIKTSTNGGTTGAASFSFGSANAASNSRQGSGKGFTFGTAASTETSAKSFSFGSSANSKPFSIGTASSPEKKSADDKPNSYGKGFSFGTSKDTTGSSYSFGATITSSGNTSTFGTSTSSGKNFSFGVSSSSSDGKTFSFGLAKSPASISSSSPAGFGLTGASKEEKKPEDDSVKVTPTGFSGFNFKPSAPLFGASTTSSTTLGTTSGFSFAVGNSAPAQSSSTEQEEEYVPPVVESVENKEEGALYSVKCKLFYQKDGTYAERGVGFLHLKTADDKLQMIVRADTTLGNILLNIVVPPTMPVQRQGKNNLSMICVPNPPIDPKGDPSKPVPMLVRVKTGDDADKLLEKIDELRKK